MDLALPKMVIDLIQFPKRRSGKDGVALWCELVSRLRVKSKYNGSDDTVRPSQLHLTYLQGVHRP